MRDHPYDRCRRDALIDRHIIEEGVGGIGGIVIVVTDQGGRVGMSCRHTGRDLHPGGIVVAGLGQNRRGRCRGGVLEGCRRPVIGQRVRTVDLVPEAQCAPTGNHEGLAERAISIRGRGTASLTGVGA